MNCTTLEQIVFAAFVISLLAANVASWRMQKLAKLDGYKGPKWKLLLGDVAPPTSVLSGKGVVWRRVSIISFIVLLFSGFAIGVLNSQGSQCFGLNS